MTEKPDGLITKTAPNKRHHPLLVGRAAVFASEPGVHHIKGWKRNSLANMLIRENDGFADVEDDQIPTSGSPSACAESRHNTIGRITFYCVSVGTLEFPANRYVVYYVDFRMSTKIQRNSKLAYTRVGIR